MVTIDPTLADDDEYSTAQQTPTDTPPHSEAPESPSAISELQEALGSLLLAQKEKPRGNFIYTDRGYAIWRPYQPPPPKCPWTGAFNLFSFPREMRDRIYFWYLKRQHRLVDKKRRERFYYNDQSPDHSHEIVTLFLTSRQVYQEALDVFCRYTRFEIRVGRGGLPGTVRVMPDVRVHKMQRVCMQYYGDRVDLAGVPDENETDPSNNFVCMMRDAHALKKCFPALREFTAGWNLYCAEYRGQRVQVEDFSEEERVEFWLGWMRAWAGVAKVKPPGWLRFEFRERYNYGPMTGHLGALNAAYRILVRESTVMSEEERERRLEESGRKWLEEAWGDVKRTRKKRISS
ncbi:hypothetical protein IQ07DRAFT_589649 [Pyrenochaeta sp. DS3sAY3a]|nr:hypothetical protein IQ07DRAFT_589649 [Pyrenochaeta sp. DS3sAY3a]